MLKLKEPLHLKSLKQLNRSYSSFEDDIMGKYELFSLNFNPQQLIFLLKGEEESFDTGITQVVYNENINEKISLNIGIFNRFINKIIAMTEQRYTYNDYVYISGFLRKAGIVNTIEFINNVHEYMQETKQISDFIRVMEQNNEVISYLQSRLFEYNSKRIKNQNVTETDDREYSIKNIEYVNNILRRLELKDNAMIVNRFLGSADTAVSYSRSVSGTEFISLSDLSETNYRTIVQTYAADNIEYCHINPYEIQVNEDINTVQQKIIAATLCNIADSVYKAYIADNIETNNHQIIINNTDWSDELCASSARYVNNIISNRNKVYYDNIRKFVYESGKNRVNLLNTYIHTINESIQESGSGTGKTDHEKQDSSRVSQLINDEQAQRNEELLEKIKSADSVMEKLETNMPGDIETVTEIVNLGMPKRADIQRVRQGALKALLGQSSTDGAELEHLKAVDNDSMSADAAVMMDNAISNPPQIGKDELNTYISNKTESIAESTAESLNNSRIVINNSIINNNSNIADNSTITVNDNTAQVSEETLEILKLVQEYLVNPEKVIESGRITVDAAVMLNDDINNQLEMTVDEYNAYISREIEKKVNISSSSVETDSRSITINNSDKATNYNITDNSGKATDYNTTNNSGNTINNSGNTINNSGAVIDNISITGINNESTTINESAASMPEETFEILKLVQEYLVNPEKVIDSGRLTAAEAIMVNNDVRNESEMTVDEYNAYISRKIEKIVNSQGSSVETDNRSITINNSGKATNYNITDYNVTNISGNTINNSGAVIDNISTTGINNESTTINESAASMPEETLEILKLVQEYLVNPEKVIESGRMAADTALMINNDVRNQPYMSVNEYNTYIIRRIENIINSSRGISIETDNRRQLVLEHVTNKLIESYSDNTYRTRIKQFHSETVNNENFTDMSQYIQHPEQYVTAVRNIVENEIIGQEYNSQLTDAGIIRVYVNNLSREGDISYIYDSNNNFNEADVQETQYQNNQKRNNVTNRTVNSSVSMNQSYSNTEVMNTMRTNNDRFETDRIRNEIEHTVENTLEHTIEKQINSISEKVYNRLEKKLSSERKRRGF